MIRSLAFALALMPVAAAAVSDVAMGDDGAAGVQQGEALVEPAMPFIEPAFHNKQSVRLAA
ncbi:MAG: hypothetical protein AAFR44_12125, partial [Pseudomonadota bacterium]